MSKRITAEEALEITLETNKEVLGEIDPLIDKIDAEISLKANQGLRRVRVSQALSMRKPNVAQWEALASHFTQRGFDWVTTETTGWGEMREAQIEW